MSLSEDYVSTCFAYLRVSLLKKSIFLPQPLSIMELSHAGRMPQSMWLEATIEEEDEDMSDGTDVGGEDAVYEAEKEGEFEAQAQAKEESKEAPALDSPSRSAVTEDNDQGEEFSESRDDTERADERAIFIGREHPELWVYNALASSRAQARQPESTVRVLETVIFRDGVAACWIVNDRKGRLRRRHRRRLKWSEIHLRIQRLGRRMRRGGPEEPIAILRWRRPKGSDVISTLLNWRELRDLPRRVPLVAGPTLTSWHQFVALQPYAPARSGAASGVFIYRTGVALRAEPTQRFGLLEPGVPRELMTWPGAPPRSRNDLRGPSSVLVRDVSLKDTLTTCAQLSVGRVCLGAGGSCGLHHYLDAALRVHSFVAEIVIDSAALRGHSTPLLTFFHDLSFLQTADHCFPVLKVPLLHSGLNTNSAYMAHSNEGDPQHGHNSVRPTERASSNPLRPHAPVRRNHWWRRNRPTPPQRWPDTRAQRIRLSTLAMILQ